MAEVIETLEQRATRAMNEVAALAWTSMSEDEAERIENLVTGVIYELLRDRKNW